MKLEQSNHNNTYILKLIGELNTNTTHEVEKEFFDILESRAYNMHFDCTELTYISSLGLRLFILAQKKAHQKEKAIGIINLNENLKKIFQEINIDKFFNFYQSIEDIT